VQNVSEEFKTAIASPSPEFESRITFPDLVLDDCQVRSINLDSLLVGGDDFEIGTAPMDMVKVELVEDTGDEWGRNLVLNSTFNNGFTNWRDVHSPYSVIPAESDKPNSKIAKVSASGLSSNQHISAFSNRFNAKVNDEFTFSVDFKVTNFDSYDVKRSFVVEFYDSTRTRIQYKDVSLTDTGYSQLENNKWYRLSYTTKATNPNVVSGAIRLCLFRNGEVFYREVKVEKGTVATDWTPAPEDVQEQLDEHNIKISTAESSITQLTNSIALKVNTSTFNSYKSTTDSAISSLSSRVNAAELKITDSAIVSTVRSSTAYKNDLSGKVGTTEIISKINQTAEQIRIQASKISLEGLVTANSNFKILSDGSIQAKNAEISGTVTANSGAIGGWQLTRWLIQYKPNSSNNNSRFFLDSGPTATYRIASYNSSGTRQFSVTSDGALYARNADISGTITSSAVTVTGGTITGALIRTNTANDRIELGNNVLRVHSGANKSMEIRRNQIRFYDWEGTTRTEPVGTIFPTRRGGSPNRPGIVLANEENAYIALAYRKGDSSPSYADFDIDNVNDYKPEYPIKLWESTFFGNKARVQVALSFGDSADAEIWHSTANNLVIKAGNQGLVFHNHNADDILRYSSSNNIWRFRRSVQIDNNLTVSGSKNSLQKTKNYGERLINAYETAEYYFGDIGFGTINDDGECVVYIDEIFKECINTDIAYHVFTQVYNGKITGIERYKDYFIVYGEPNTSFSWEIKAKRIGYEHYRLEQPTRFEADDLDPYNFDLELIERRETGEDEKLTKMYDDILSLDLSKILLEV